MSREHRKARSVTPWHVPRGAIASFGHGSVDVWAGQDPVFVPSELGGL